MTGPALNLTEEQVAYWGQKNIWPEHVTDLADDWRTLRAALDKQVKENEQILVAQAKILEENRYLQSEVEDAEKHADRAEFALAAANEITDEKVERGVQAAKAQSPHAYHDTFWRPVVRAALLAVQGKQPEGGGDPSTVIAARKGGTP